MQLTHLFHTFSGSLRFSSPVAVKAWDSILEAKRLPNACMQTRNEFFGNFSGSQPWNPNTPISEDCLYLNVFAPVAAKEVKIRKIITRAD
jgi:carboxylesterase type B